MLDVNKTLPKDPDDLKQFTALLLAEVTSQAVLMKNRKPNPSAARSQIISRVWKSY